MAEERDSRAIWAACSRTVGAFAPADRSARATLLELAERAPDETEVDRYGEGALATRVEARVGELLGKEAALWLPSGTMAQQIALRIHAGRRGLQAVAFHPCCHLDVHEERGFEWLHGLHAVHVGSRERLIAAADIEGLREPYAALLLELPQRDLGGQLPPWDDLVAACEAARSRGAALHLDGARLWQCEPFYGKSLAEISGLFDTVYVSFYKDLGAPAGCALAGPKELIDEARVWQVRHGGRMFSVYPFLLAAERGLLEVVPRMPAFVERAREAAGVLRTLDGVSLVPDPPQTAMVHVLVRRELEPLRDAFLDVAESSRVWLGVSWSPTEDPAVQRAELTVGEASFAVPLDELAALWSDALARAATWRS